MAESKPKYVLSYFNIKALAEPIRFLLAYGNIDFEDRRISREDWPKIKATMPNAQMPVLQIGSKTTFQHLAICRYLGKQFGLAGSNDWEAFEIDMAADTISDLRTKSAIVFYEPNESIKETKYVQLLSEVIPTILKNLEEMAAANKGHMALGKMTWADFLLAGLIEYLNLLCRQDLIANCPNLKAAVNSVTSLPAIKAWNAKAPKPDM
ncbi:glutathione S-transferase-like [Arctopsyche grandis]|uniref:glutathione S-transferase-like n=1 Tax=Arctopsyche grandis TaxID=121162 RepID=UPI00406D7771